ncbi:hypothetical protein Tco_0789620 [Tanacetum coccineum]
MKAVRSSYHVLIVPSLSSSSHVFASPEFMNVFVRIGFNSTIKLVSFDESQVVTLNGEFVCGFQNGDCGTESQSDNTVSSPHLFIIYWIVIFKDIKKVTEIVDVKNWSVHSGSGSGLTSSELEARVCIQGSYMVQFARKLYDNFEKESG